MYAFKSASESGNSERSEAGDRLISPNILACTRSTSPISNEGCAKLDCATWRRFLERSN